MALLAFLFPLAYSPGPGNAFFAGIGASKGLRAAIPALTGYHVATFVVTAVIGLGMGVAHQPVPRMPTRRMSGFKSFCRAGGSASGGSITMATPSGIEQHDVSLPLRSTDGEIGVRLTSAKQFR